MTRSDAQLKYWRKEDSKLEPTFSLSVEYEAASLVGYHLAPFVYKCHCSVHSQDFQQRNYL